MSTGDRRSKPGAPSTRPDAAGAGVVARRTARIAATRGTAEILGKVATLAWTVAAARLLTQTEFGGFSFALSLMMLISALPAWGFDALLIRRGSAEPEALSRLHTEATVWKTALALPVFAIAGSVAALFRPTVEATVVLALVLVAGLPELWNHTARSSSAVRQRPFDVSMALVFQRVVTAAIIVVVLAAGGGVVGIAAGFLAGSILGWLAHVWALRRLRVRVRWRYVTADGLRRGISGTLFIGASAIILVLLFRVDIVFLAVLKGDREVALYTAAFRLMETVLFITWAINQAILPVMSASSSVERIRKGFEKGVALAAFVYLPFAAVCLVEPERVLSLLFGTGYAEPSAPMLMWLAPTPVLFAGGMFASSVLLARGRSGVTLVAATVAAVGNVAMNLALIPHYGGTGAAVATTSSYLLNLLVLTSVGGRSGVPLRPIRPLLEAGAASVVAAGALLILSAPLLVELGAAAAVYLMVWALLARQFAPDQLAVALSPLARRAAR